MPGAQAANARIQNVAKRDGRRAIGSGGNTRRHAFEQSALSGEAAVNDCQIIYWPCGRRASGVDYA